MLCYPTVLLTMQQIFGWKNGSCHFAFKSLLPYCPTDHEQRLKCKMARTILTHLGQMPIIRTKLNAGEWRRVAGWMVKVVMAALAAAQAVFEQGIVNLTQKRPQKCWKFLALLLTFWH